MIVFVSDDHVSGVTSDDVTVVAVYGDDAILPPDAHPNCVKLSVDGRYVQTVDHSFTLLKGWREGLGASINVEAQHRIEAAFPPWAQRNAALAMVLNIIQYGADEVKWPASEREKLATVKKGMDQITSLRAQSNLLKGKGVGVPSAPSNWPDPPKEPIKL